MIQLPFPLQSKHNPVTSHFDHKNCGQKNPEKRRSDGLMCLDKAVLGQKAVESPVIGPHRQTYAHSQCNVTNTAAKPPPQIFHRLSADTALEAPPQIVRNVPVSL